jgi:hypothetical protein
VAFGTGWLNEGVAALPMFCAGSYSPPDGLQQLVTPAENTALTAHSVQGYDTAARLALYKTAGVQLSSSVDAEPGQKGHQQHLMDIQFAAHPFAKAWINHPGEDDPWGTNRPSYWAGNGTMPRVGQHENTCLMIYDLGDAPRLAFTHVYAPLEWFDDYRLGDNHLLLRSGNAYAALGCSHPLFPVTQGPGKGIEFRSEAKRLAWFATVGNLPQGGLDAVAASLEKSSFTFDPIAMRAQMIGPKQPVLTLVYASGLFVDGNQKPFPNEHVVPDVQWVPAVPAGAANNQHMN